MNFLIVIILIVLYQQIYNYLNNFYKELNIRDSKNYSKPSEKYKSYKNFLSKIIPILLFIQKWRNPFFVVLLYIDKKLFNIMRFIYEILKRYSYNEKYRLICYLIIIYVFGLGLIKLVFGYYYKLISEFLLWNIDIFTFVIIKLNDLCIIILIASYILLIIKLYGVIIMCIFIYFMFSLILIIYESLFILKIYNENKLIKLIHFYYKVDNIIYHRMHYTILGRLITIISEIILDLEEDLPEQKPKAKVGSYIIYTLNNQIIICIYRKRYSYIYMDNISCVSMIKGNYLECTFLTYWTFLKLNYKIENILIQNRRNYPSAYLFHSLILSFNSLYGPGMKLTETYYYKLKCQENHLVLNEKEILNLEFLYKFDILRLKIILYMLWDIIENCKDFNGISNYGGLPIDLNIHWNEIILIDDLNDYIGLKVLKIPYNLFDIEFKLDNYKKEMKFYDIESNLNYFVKLFDYLGYVKTDYGYKGADIEYDKMCGRYYISPKLELYSIKFLYLLNMFEVDLCFNRITDLNISYKYEIFIQKYLKNLLIELRSEWLCLKHTKTLENRNISLLLELIELNEIVIKRKF